VQAGIQRLKTTFYDFIKFAFWLFNARMHEGLYELSLEQQKGNEQGGDGHESGCGYNRPVHAGFRGAENTQINRQRPGFHRVGHDEGPQEIVPIDAFGFHNKRI